MKTRKHLLLIVICLSYLMFSSCSNKKSGVSDLEKNLFEVTSDAATQILRPCSWSYDVEQNSNGEAILISTAKLDSGWHLYSQHISGKGAPSTEFAYDSSDTYRLLGGTEEEGEPHKKYETYLGMEVRYFEQEAVFKQKIKVLSETDFTITGNIDYMVCLDQCVQSDEEFSFSVKGNPQGI